MNEFKRTTLTLEPLPGGFEGIRQVSGNSLHSVSGHTFDTSKLTKGGWVLDVGCRDFEFARYCAALGCNVIALDPSDDIVDPEITGVRFERVALVHDDVDSLPFTFYGGEDNRLVRVGRWADLGRTYDVPCTTIKDLMHKYNVLGFDLIKMDCEGSEYDLMLNVGPVARQISVEFHDFMSLNPCKPPAAYYDKLLAYLSPWYRIEKHEPPYIDSLFVRA